MSGLTEEIAKLRHLSDSLRAEVDELRQNAEKLAREKVAVVAELALSGSELTRLQQLHEELTARHDQLTSDMSLLGHQRDDLGQSLEAASAAQAALEAQLAGAAAAQEALTAAAVQLRETRAEADSLRQKLRQLEAVSSLTELKEENAMLSERVSQLEEQLSEGGGETPAAQQQLLSQENLDGDLRIQAEDHLLEKSKLRYLRSLRGKVR